MVYFLDSFRSLFSLRWTQSPAFHPLPSSVNRTFVKTRSGNIELLVSSPSSESYPPTGISKPPVLFVHGGFGQASVWLPWMTYLHSKHYDGTTYAVSIRGHGASWTPGFWQMCALATKDVLATDVVAAIKEIERREGGKKVVLVGHSSGGGLSQLILSNGLAKAQGLALVAAIPNFGS
jgi:pimeloyl-ACP methyl ester carboxylesterase